jgi:hypothetical protein
MIDSLIGRVNNPMTMLVEIGKKRADPLVIPILELFNGTLDISLPQPGFKLKPQYLRRLVHKIHSHWATNNT